MTQLATVSEQSSGRERVSYEEFLRVTDGMHAEWVDGEVTPGVPISRTHDSAHNFLHLLMGAHVDDRKVGEVHRDPFQKTGPSLPGRAPDLIFVANEHLDRLHEHYLEGPADLAVEIVSPGNASTDYVDKYREYEMGGVLEYWILDPVNQSADFFVLREGRYAPVLADDSGVYRSTALPGFWLRVAWLWERPPLDGVLDELLARPPGRQPRRSGAYPERTRRALSQLMCSVRPALAYPAFLPLCSGRHNKGGPLHGSIRAVPAYSVVGVACHSADRFGLWGRRR